MKIVCLHGAGESAEIWEPQAASDLDIKALDLPGHGEAGGSGFDNVPAYAGWVSRQLAGSEPLILAGHSLGGAIALSLALQAPRPEWLAGLVLVATGARLRVHPRIFATVETDFEAAIDLICDWEMVNPHAAEIRAVLERGLRQAGPKTAYGDYLAADQFDVMDELERVDVPALILCGLEDRMTPPKYAEYLARNIPTSKLVLIPGAGHAITLEQPEMLTTEIQRFGHDLDGD